MTKPSRASRSLLRSFLGALVAVVVLATAAAAAPLPVEGYAPYEPQTVCRSKPLVGTVGLARWIDASYGGGTPRATMRSCGSSGTSEHKDGRAIDWTMSATKPRHRRIVNRFLARIFAADELGNNHALARRMGVMYIIWNDRIYSSYRGFEPRAYLNSGCKSLSACSKTLRHRDHVHISLSNAGAKAQTSWYLAPAG